MPRPSTTPLVLEQLLLTILPGNNFHDRWILDEEIANAIKDDKCSIITNYSNLNRLISRKWSFNKGIHVVNHYAITKFTTYVKNMRRQQLTFYYITRPTNVVHVPPITSPTWKELYNLYLDKSSPILEETTETTIASPNKRQRTGEKSINSNNTLSTKVTVSQEMKYSVVFVSKLRHAL